MKTSVKTTAAALALAVGATTAVAAPAGAQEVQAPTGTVQYAATDSGSSANGGSLENEMVQSGLVLAGGLAVAAGLAVMAGIRGGAFPLPQIPGLPAF